MTKEEALNNIGQQFKVIDFSGSKFDIIREVDGNGFITGDFTIAHHNDCRLKADQPENFKKIKKEKSHA